MKKHLLCLLLISSLASFSQENENTSYTQDVEKKYELKVNAFNLIAFASLDVSFEKLINQNSSFGVAVFYNFSDLDDDIVFTKKFSLTPYYRWFFSESKFARGFFVEGFGMLNTFEDEYYNYIGPNYEVVDQTSFALGIAVGGKFVTKTGFTAEVYAGVGRNLIQGDSNDDYFLDNDVVGRFGISLGYRF